jgi:hypothetical protein
MNGTDSTAGDGGSSLETLAAELTAAAYPVALRHGAAEWLDLELDLWRVLTETVKKQGREVGPPLSGE